MQREQLIQQIGFYGDVDNEEFVRSRLNENGLKALYQSDGMYWVNEHRKKVKTYQKSHIVSGSSEDTHDPKYFRKKFIELIDKISQDPSKRYRVPDPDPRKTNPEAATVTMEDFLGPDGVELYKLALQEEMHSQAYMNAVFKASTEHYNGAKWTKRPVVIVAGPSACGKSFAANAAVKHASTFLPKLIGNNEGNDVISVDGGIVREVSQMRKLVIQVANNHGFTGLENLHKKSGCLNKVKDKLQTAVLKTSSLGLVIPETFSSWPNPFSKIRELMRNLDRLPNTVQIFSRVDGEDPTNFQKVVKFMGSRRAWKTKDFVQQELDLNIHKRKIPESKAYGYLLRLGRFSKNFTAVSFNSGVNGSKAAEAWYREHSKHKLTLNITNDLIILKPSDIGWESAEEDDQGAILVSRRVYEHWKTLQLKSDELLTEEERRLKALSLPDYGEETAKSIIHSSAEVHIAIAKEAIRSRLAEVIRQHQKLVRNNAAPETITRQKQKITWLTSLYMEINAINTGTANLIPELVASLNEKISACGTSPFHRKTKKALNNALSAIESAAQGFANIAAMAQPQAQAVAAIAPEVFPVIDSQTAIVEALYQKLLLGKALSIAQQQAVEHRCIFDPYGHAIVTLSLTDADYLEILDQIPGLPRPYTQSPADLLRALLGEKMHRSTLCSIDVAHSPVLQDAFKSWLTAGSGFHAKLTDAYIALFKTGRDSIIPLQEEMQLHMMLASRVLQQAVSEFPPYDTLIHKWEIIRAHATHKINAAVKKHFQKALLLSYNYDSQLIDVGKLNELLDKSRKELAELARQELFIACADQNVGFGVSFEQFYLEKIANREKQLKKSFQHTTATDLDTFRTSSQTQMMTRISGTNNTSHHKRLGQGTMALRLVNRNHFTIDAAGEIAVIPRDKIEFRVPSIAIRKLSIADGRDDVVVKLQEISEQMQNRGHRGAWQYNLLTSLYRTYEDYGSNQQRKSAEMILTGAHVFNRMQKDAGEPQRFCYVQNIPVNQHGEPLSYTGNNTQKEAAMMVDISMLFTLQQYCEHFPAAIKQQIEQKWKEVHNLYCQSLERYTGGFLHETPSAQQIKAAIDSFKSAHAASELASPDDFTTLAAQALFKIYVANLQMNLQFGMFIQSLAIFLEKAKIAGCKSANERYVLTTGLAEVFAALSHGGISDEVVVTSKNALSAFIRDPDVSPENQRIALARLQNTFETIFNEHNLYANSSISCIDQGASFKIKPSKSREEGYVAEYDTNVAVSATFTHLKQKNVAAMQAHHKHQVTKFNQAAKERLVILDKLCGKMPPLKDYLHQNPQYEVHTSEAQAALLSALGCPEKYRNMSEETFYSYFAHLNHEQRPPEALFQQLKAEYSQTRIAAFKQFTKKYRNIEDLTIETNRWQRYAVSQYQSLKLLDTPSLKLTERIDVLSNIAELLLDLDEYINKLNHYKQHLESAENQQYQNQLVIINQQLTDLQTALWRDELKTLALKIIEEQLNSNNTSLTTRATLTKKQRESYCKRLIEVTETFTKLGQENFIVLDENQQGQILILHAQAQRIKTKQIHAGSNDARQIEISVENAAMIDKLVQADLTTTITEIIRDTQQLGTRQLRPQLSSNGHGFQYTSPIQNTMMGKHYHSHTNLYHQHEKPMLFKLVAKLGAATLKNTATQPEIILGGTDAQLIRTGYAMALVLNYQVTLNTQIKIDLSKVEEKVAKYRQEILADPLLNALYNASRYEEETSARQTDLGLQPQI